MAAACWLSLVGAAAPISAQPVVPAPAAVPAAAAMVTVQVPAPVPAPVPAFGTAAVPGPLGADLPGLLAHARAQSPEWAAMRLEADAALQRVGPAGALADPVLRVELMNFNNHGTPGGPSLLPWKVGETRYTLMQALPLAGKRGLRRDQAAADAQAAQSKAQATWAELAMRIKTSWAELYRTVARQRLTQELLGLMQQMEQVAQVRYAGGLAGQPDALRAQLEQTAMRADLLMLESDRRQAQARLNGLLAREPGAALADPQALRTLPTLESEDAPGLAERARQSNPQLQAEAARLAAAQKGRDLARANHWPDLVVGVQPTQMGSRLTTWVLMVELNIPLQRDTRRSQDSEADAMVRAVQARADALRHALQAELAVALANLDAARRNQALISRQWLPQAELGLQSALAAYENGKAEFAMVLDAQRQIRNARLALLQAQVEAQMRLAEIERIVGEDL